MNAWEILLQHAGINTTIDHKAIITLLSIKKMYIDNFPIQYQHRGLVIEGGMKNLSRHITCNSVQYN